MTNEPPHEAKPEPAVQRASPVPGAVLALIGLAAALASHWLEQPWLLGPMTLALLGATAMPFRSPDLSLSGTPKHTGLILQKGGSIQREAIKGDTVHGKPNGLYLVEVFARHWNDAPIPRGWLTVWVAGDPEPISTRKPTGYDPKTLEMLTGKQSVHLVQGGLPTHRGLGAQGKRILLILLGLIAAGAIGIMVWRSRFG